MGEPTTNSFSGAHNFTFKTERLLLRPLRLDDTDIELVYALKSDPEVTFWQPPFTHTSQASDWIKARLETKVYLSFCVEELQSPSNNESPTAKPQVIGLCGGTKLPEIGYMYRPSVWGRGYATEALNGFIKFYWETFPQGHPSIEAAEEKEYLLATTGPPDEHPNSASSMAVLKKCGFDFWEYSPSPVPGESGVMLLGWRRWGPGYSPEEVPEGSF
ncbi:MAG: hypothetical protein Q9170_007859 [Blastenia crenularia]